MIVKEKISRLLKALGSGLYERDLELRLALLSSVAGESIFLLGPPGVAKSLVARKLKYAYRDAGVFEFLMSRFSTPDEIFGPVAISKLKNDTYERVTDGYLPSSEVVFLDEIWKAGPSIQNALLTVINEKVFRNGNREVKVPMKALISASNELPAKDQGLEALWDRFLIRLAVPGIEGRENFDRMITETSNAYEDSVEREDDKITNDEYEAWRKKIDGVAVPESVLDVIHRVRLCIAEHNRKAESAVNMIYVSDRRWRKIVRLLRASAFLNGRAEVDMMDCFLIRHCIWGEEAQMQTVHGFVKDAVARHGCAAAPADFFGIREALGEFGKSAEACIRKAKKAGKHDQKAVSVLDGQADALLRRAAGIRAAIEEHSVKKLSQLRTNLFVEPALAKVVESGVNAARVEIDKIEVEIRSIQNDCKNLKGGNGTEASGNSGGSSGRKRGGGAPAAEAADWIGIAASIFGQSKKGRS